MPFTAIGEVLGYSYPYIQKQYRKALKDIIVDDVKLVRAMELEKLDKLYDKAMLAIESFQPLIASGQVIRDVVDDSCGNPIRNEDGKSVTVRLRDMSLILQGIDRAVKIMERRARLLGLDKPVKVAATNPNGDKEASFMQFYLPQNGRDDPLPAEVQSEEVSE
jgi:hypothetical protein